MKDYSPFLLKNINFGSKMKKGFRNFCHGVNSISTLKQKAEADISRAAARSVAGSYMDESDAAASPMTLDQMILQLDMDEEATRRDRDRVHEYSSGGYRRMSCVNNSDILRSARNALSQYPRFSLDGKDAMYRSSFLNFEGGRRSSKPGCQLDLERNLCLPPTVAGESVVWCEPGVVAKLMGLDALPVPVAGRKRIGDSVSASRKRCLKMNGKHELERERERLQLRLLHCRKGRVESSGSCSAAGSYYLLPDESDLR
ncbi:uncharacterized protein LOC141842685 [Curcuma longa]|uniref:uncharacterized protein LOC141842685 n=1 Tax=Curcuma longa TaxID=136217 RepID=UPI003D9E0463